MCTKNSSKHFSRKQEDDDVDGQFPNQVLGLASCQLEPGGDTDALKSEEENFGSKKSCPYKC